MSEIALSAKRCAFCKEANSDILVEYTISALTAIGERKLESVGRQSSYQGRKAGSLQQSSAL